MDKKKYKLIQKSAYFDKKYYLKYYSEVQGQDPILHYLQTGWEKGYNPSERFDTTFYLYTYRDVKVAKLNPLVHYLEYGKKEGRKANEEDTAMPKQIAISRIKKSINFIKHIKNNPNILKKGVFYVKKYGVSETLKKVRMKFYNQASMPPQHYNYTAAHLTVDIIKEITRFTKQPFISIIMPVYNVDPQWLDLAIKSIELQWYKNWELCIADDKSTNLKTLEYLKSLNNPKIKIIFLEHNLNISGASNAALSLATGEYIALMDNDDEITPDALYEVVKAINKTDAEFIYSDEDSLTTNGSYTNPHFKPSFTPDLLWTHNYITHFSIIKKNLFDKVGSFNSEFDGAQDHDLFLRVSFYTHKIFHISKVLYHWRMIPSSTNSNPYAKPKAMENAKKMIEKNLRLKNIEATVEHLDNMPYFFRIRRKLLKTPLVSIIIPFKDKQELLKMCVESILTKSTYSNFEIIGISNNSSEKVTFEEIKRLEKLDIRVKFYECNIPFNYSHINNYAVENYAAGEHIILLNNDIEIISEAWIEEMLMHSQRDEVGCVGAKLYYPNNTVQHAGVIIGIGGIAGHGHKGINRYNFGYFNRAAVTQNFAAVTAACLMVKKSIYIELKGLDKDHLSVAFNDVDFCLRAMEKGYLNVLTPFAEAYHHESISRGYEDTPEKIKRFEQEVAYMRSRHKGILEDGDPYYNQNLTLDREDFSLR